MINIARARLLTRGDMTAKDFSMADVLSWACFRNLTQKIQRVRSTGLITIALVMAARMLLLQGLF